MLSFSFGGNAQEGLQMGLEISPAWNLNVHRSKVIKSWSFESGYGFNVGLPLKYWFSETMAIQSGLTYEYVAFDNRFNSTLVSSYRYGSLHVPVMFNLAMKGGWNAIFGAGLNYNIMNKFWAGNSVDITPSIQSVQPYVGGGASTLLERNKGVFEIGVQARYHFLELSDKNVPTVSDFSSNILSFDLIMRFYLVNK